MLHSELFSQKPKFVLHCTVHNVELRVLPKVPGRSCSGEKSACVTLFFPQQVIRHSLLVGLCIWWTSRTKINPEFITADNICLGGIVTCDRTEEVFPVLFVKALPLKFKLWKHSLFFFNRIKPCVMLTGGLALPANQSWYVRRVGHIFFCTTVIWVRALDPYSLLYESEKSRVWVWPGSYARACLNVIVFKNRDILEK